MREREGERDRERDRDRSNPTHRVKGRNLTIDSIEKL
jgi:hypothetical protein